MRTPDAMVAHLRTFGKRFVPWGSGDRIDAAASTAEAADLIEQMRESLSWYAQEFHDRWHGAAGIAWQACRRGRCRQTALLLGEPS